MGKVLYLSLLDTNPNVLPYSGVMKKILLHIDAFRSYGHSVDYVETDEKNIFYVQDNKKTNIGNYCSSGYIYYNRIFSSASKFIKKNKLKYDYIYVRHSALSLFGYLNLAYLKQIANRIYFEIPTYSVPPKCIKNTIKFYFNKKIRKYVDRMVIDCNETEVYGIPTIRVINGTDLSKITPRRPTPNPTQINVMLVAYLQEYHGVDKIFKAISEYYKSGGSRKVFIHVVGYGPKLDEYKKTVEEQNLSDYIKFYGKLSGQSLDDIFNKCEIGISSLANKEIGVTYSSTLKSKEYLAKGLPIISDVMLDVFYESPKYFFYQLEKDFNIPELVKFYDSVYQNHNKQDVINEIRSYANITCDMYKVLKAVDDDYLISRKITL